MTEFNYLKEKRRMLDALGRTHGSCNGANCIECLLYHKNNGHKDDNTVNCVRFEMEYPEEATAIVRKWAEEHSRKTRKDVLLEKFPNTKIDETGRPRVCAENLGIMRGDDCGKYVTCIECWSTEV